MNVYIPGCLIVHITSCTNIFTYVSKKCLETKRVVERMNASPR